MLWDTLAQPWQACIEEAWLAYQAGTLPIGAVITDAAGQIVARGRNRILDPTPQPRSLWSTQIAHAEINAIAVLDQREHRLSDYTLYTTTEPCPMCMGAIRMSHLGTLHYASRDPLAGSTSMCATMPFMQRAPQTIHGPPDADLEALIMALHVEFSLRRSYPRMPAVIAPWREVCPRGVALGTYLWQHDELQRLRDAAAPTGEMVDALHLLLEQEGPTSGI